jgi:hypothetical protein
MTAEERAPRMRKYFDLLFGRQMDELLAPCFPTTEIGLLCSQGLLALITRSDAERALVSVFLPDHQSQALLR